MDCQAISHLDAVSCPFKRPTFVLATRRIASCRAMDMFGKTTLSSRAAIVYLTRIAPLLGPQLVILAQRGCYPRDRSATAAPAW